MRDAYPDVGHRMFRFFPESVTPTFVIRRPCSGRLFRRATREKSRAMFYGTGAVFAARRMRA